MTSFLYWILWLFSLIATGMLLAWHLPFRPFSDPGATANTSPVLFMLLGFVRWLSLAVCLVMVAVLWLRLRGASAWPRKVVPVAIVAAHVLLGLVNLGVWNAWLGAGRPHTPSGDTALAVAYFAMPTVLILALAIVKLALPVSPDEQ